MKDYSKFIQSSYGFITKYEIVDDEIHIYTAESKKGEPHKYPANKEWISYVESRLENQYKLLFANKEMIKKDYLKKKDMSLVVAIASVCAILLSLGVFLSLSVVWPLMLTLGAVGFAFLGNSAVLDNATKEFDEEMKILEVCINKRNEIEKRSRQDKNVTEYLSFQAAKRLANNEELRKMGTLDSSFNIDFMDKTKLKDLKKLLQRYLISVGLTEEQKFVASGKDEKMKRKTKKAMYENK